MKNRISIITASLNRSSLLSCCESVNRQTFRDWHHFVLGDGLLPHDYRHENRTTIGFSRPLGAYEPALDKPNGTPNPILRWGIQHLDLGEYLCFLDDDNTYEPDFLLEMLNAIEDSKTGIVLCALNDLRNEDIHDGFPELGRCDNSAFLVRSEIAKSIGFPWASETYDNIQDFEFIKKCADDYGWSRVERKLVNFGITVREDPPYRADINK